MGRLSLNVEAVQTISADLSGQATRNVRNAVWRFGLDLEVSSGGVVEVLVEELQGMLEHFGADLITVSLTSFAGLAISLKGTGMPDMMTVVEDERNEED